MNATEHLITCLGEEASEIAQDCCKSLRFGLNDVNVLKPKGPNNRERLLTELNQLLAVVSLLVEEGILPAGWCDVDAQIAKKKKVKKFMDYARNVGALK